MNSRLRKIEKLIRTIQKRGQPSADIMERGKMAMLKDIIVEHNCKSVQDVMNAIRQRTEEQEAYMRENNITIPLESSSET